MTDFPYIITDTKTNEFLDGPFDTIETAEVALFDWRTGPSVKIVTDFPPAVLGAMRKNKRARSGRDRLDYTARREM